jgi:alkylation response protein AidB-like acyl-CoA dehydrogenase
MTAPEKGTSLRPLLGSAIPPLPLPPAEATVLAAVQEVIDAELAPAAGRVDEAGRYPDHGIAGLKRSGLLTAAIPERYGGLGASNRFSVEAQVRLGTADSSVAQVFKIHDEMVREIFKYCPDGFGPRFARLLHDGAIIGLAVAENGRRVDAPMQTIAVAGPDGSFTVTGEKIYTTGAAGADYIAVWAFDPAAGAEDFRLGLRLSLIPPAAPGVTIHRDWDNIGQRGTESGTLTLTGVRVEPEFLANVPGRSPLSHAPLRYQLGFAAILVGLGFGALDAARSFVVERSRPWPSADVEHAGLDPIVRRLAGELTADLAAAYAVTSAAGAQLDTFENGNIGRTDLALPIYIAKSVATRAALRATSEVFQLMGTRSTARRHGFDRWWRNARTLALHDPVDWKHVEIGDHVINGWEPPFGIYT